jgi:hypothetical protein
MPHVEEPHEAVIVKAEEPHAVVVFHDKTLYEKFVEWWQDNVG